MTAFLLFGALWNHPYNYYIFLRWVVFLVATWSIYKSLQLVHDRHFFIILHIVLLILFNPFLPFSFEKSTWIVIDLLTGWIFLMSVFILDSIPINDFLERSRTGTLGLVIGSLWGIGLLGIGVFILYLQADKLIEGLWLWTNGKQTQAQISKVAYRLHESESEGGDIDYENPSW